MGTGKKVALGCAGCFAIVVAVVATIVGFVYFKKRQYDPQVRDFLAEAMPVLGRWDQEAFRYYWAQEALDSMSREDETRLFMAFRALGGLESYGEPRFVQIGKHVGVPYPATIAYNVEAKFDAGDALISFVFVRDPEEKRLRVWYLNINSKAFLPSVSPTPPSGDAPPGSESRPRAVGDTD